MTKAAQAIKVMLVDDHDVVRRGLAVFLSAFPDMQLVGEAKNGRQAVTLCSEVEPDVVVMDLLMPELDGVEATQLILDARPDIHIVILTSTKDEKMVKGALQAGAISYLLKNASFEEMEQAIRAAYRGMRILSPEATEALISASTPVPTPLIGLTERELQVLALMARGHSNPVIAHQLAISLSTIKFHVSSILAKLGASSRTEAVARAIEVGIVTS